MAEVRRFVHPQAAARAEADAASAELAHLIADLNTDPRLYAALVEICAQGEKEGSRERDTLGGFRSFCFHAFQGFDEEQRRVAGAYRSELEAHGVHLLNDEARGQMVELQTRLARLSYAFGNGDGSQLYGLLEAREQLANLLGFSCYADYVMPSKVQAKNICCFRVKKKNRFWDRGKLSWTFWIVWNSCHVHESVELWLT